MKVTFVLFALLYCWIFTLVLGRKAIVINKGTTQHSHRIGTVHWCKIFSEFISYLSLYPHTVWRFKFHKLFYLPPNTFFETTRVGLISNQMRLLRIFCHNVYCVRLPPNVPSSYFVCRRRFTSFFSQPEKIQASTGSRGTLLKYLTKVKSCGQNQINDQKLLLKKYIAIIISAINSFITYKNCRNKLPNYWQSEMSQHK